MKRKEKTFLVVHQEDGEIYIEKMTTIEIMSFQQTSPNIKFAIIEGDIIKGFSKSFSEFLG